MGWRGGENKKKGKGNDKVLIFFHKNIVCKLLLLKLDIVLKIISYFKVRAE